jgi:4-amino-4-deoxy-L-arabinose transferase-like glycosyltransferase
MRWKLTKERSALLLVLLCAAALRLYTIGWSLPNRFHTATYNCDESTALTRLQGMNPSKLDFNPVSAKSPDALSEGTFNLYTYGALLKLLSAVKYVTLTQDKDFYYSNIGQMARLYLAGRLLSVFYGLLSVWAVYLLAKRAYSTRAGLLAAFFMAAAPASIVYSRYIVMNVPGMFWIALSFVFMEEVVRLGRPRDYFLSGMSIGLAAATRYSAGPLFLMLILAHFIRGGEEERRGSLALGLSAIALFFFIGAPYTLLDLPDFLKGLRGVGGLATAGSSYTLLGNALSLLRSFNEALGPALLLLCAAGAAAAPLRRKKEDILPLAWVVLLLLVFLKAGAAATPGRILPVLPLLFVLAAAVVDRTWTRFGAAALAAVALQTAVFCAAYFALTSAQDIRDAASEWMQSQIKPGASIGLLREPSWFSPGLIDRKYRHPEYTGLPDYSYVPLTTGKWGSDAGYGKLDGTRPDYIVVSSDEERYLPGRSFLPAAVRYGYREIKRFSASFSFFGLRLTDRIPGMFFIPDDIAVFRLAGGPSVKKK